MELESYSTGIVLVSGKSGGAENRAYLEAGILRIDTDPYQFGRIVPVPLATILVSYTSMAVWLLAKKKRKKKRVGLCYFLFSLPVYPLRLSPPQTN